MSRKPQPDRPYFVPNSVDFLEGLFAAIDEFHAFEWGCGESTIWLARRCASLITIEHDKKWYDKIRDRLAHDGEAICKPIMILKALDDGYESVIDKIKKLNLICVDGRKRNECIEHAIPVLASGGYLLLDNSERPRYGSAIRAVENWPQWHFDYPDGGWRTSIWKKP